MSEQDIPIRHRPQDDLTDEGREQIERELERRIAPDDWQVVEEALKLGTGPHSDNPMDEYHDAAIAALARLREREAQYRKEFGDALYEMRERAEAAEAELREAREDWRIIRAEAEARVAEAEGIIHSALVTGSDPSKALREAMDALGGESIPVALAHKEETP